MRKIHKHIARLEALGIHFQGASAMLDPAAKRDIRLAMDAANALYAQDAAQPSMVTVASSALPSVLTTFVDPDILRVLQSPLEAVAILPEEKKGTWLDTSLMFPTAERTGVVASYGDWNESGSTGVNLDFISRQVYNYQTMLEYGDQQMERMGLARLQLASELREAAIWALNNYQNLTYFYGLSGLQIYGLLNDPALPVPIAPALKAYGNNRWITGNTITATANEIYQDIQALFIQLVRQSNGNIKAKDPLKLCCSPASMQAMTAANIYNVTVRELIAKAYPNMEFIDAMQYGASSASNPQGNAVGELVQLISPEVKGQKTGTLSYPEKLRAFPIIRATSSYRQKLMQSTSGAVIRQPFAFAQMIGV